MMVKNLTGNSMLKHHVSLLELVELVDSKSPYIRTFEDMNLCYRSHNNYRLCRCPTYACSILLGNRNGGSLEDLSTPDPSGSADCGEFPVLLSVIIMSVLVCVRGERNGQIKKRITAKDFQSITQSLHRKTHCTMTWVYIDTVIVSIATDHSQGRVERTVHMNG